MNRKQLTTITTIIDMLFTSESVTSGHPDKICDQISDAILDACLSQDSSSKVAIDCWVKGNNLGIIGELSTTAKIDLESIARQKIAQIGYNDDILGFNSQTCNIQTVVSKQSLEIEKAVFENELKIKELGAGDQGLMFGYACKQTPELMPLPILFAHKLSSKLETVRNFLASLGDFSLRPDGKTQVTIQYKENGEIDFINTILVSSQHHPEISDENLYKLILNNVIEPVVQDLNLQDLYIPDSNNKNKKTKILINPSGSFIEGGPVADSGLTGRKIVVDGYGGWGRVGGGAFSGKDATKVDRSGAYMARFLAKKLVSLEMANTCEIQLSYAIGKAEPISLEVFGDLNVKHEKILDFIQNTYDLRPRAIIDFLKLTDPIFTQTSVYGHFGKPQFTWETV